MNRVPGLIWIVLFVLVSACGNGTSPEAVRITGTIDLSGLPPPPGGPVFVALLNENPVNAKNGIEDHVTKITSVNTQNPEFSFDLGNTTVDAGETVYIVAFEDCDFSGSPNLTPGDSVGFYMDPETLSTSYVVRSGKNPPVLIKIDREVFSFESSISGTITGPDTGNITMVAYAGEINSLDFTSFNYNDIIGYSVLVKDNDTVSYDLTILPYGRNVPIEHVYLFGILDINNSGTNDPGDKIAFYPGSDGLPQLLTIEEGRVAGLDLSFTMELPEPSGYSITMDGRFDTANELITEQGKRFIIISKSDASDRGNVKIDFSTVKYFSKLPDGVDTFNIDLSGTDLVPGDDVMVTVLSDNDYVAGFPSVTAGDYLGYYQNTADFRTTATINNGNTIVEPAGEWAFEINRVFYDHQASVVFELDDSNLNTLFVNSPLDPGEHVTALAVQKAGVTMGLNPEIHMDYVIGAASVIIPAGGNDGQKYAMNILPAIYHRINVNEPFSIDDVYIFALFDGNHNGTESQNNYVGYYWELNPYLFYMQPKAVPTMGNTENVLDKAVKFTTTKY